jgi:hypothetical protein
VSAHSTGAGRFALGLLLLFGAAGGAEGGLQPVHLLVIALGLLLSLWGGLRLDGVPTLVRLRAWRARVQLPAPRRTVGARRGRA